VTDDEAFVRAIVAAPADEAPRLVYADWLDERGDLRGAYLRAELKWGRRRGYTSDEVTTLANSLDSLWVSRVSRPRIGVCCDGVTFSDGGSPLTIEDVRLAEQRVGHQFPSDYRAFLMNVNGGRPDRNSVAQDSSDLDEMVPPLRVDDFLSAGVGDRVSREFAAGLTQANHDDWPEGLIPVARVNETGHLLLGVGGRVWGQVYRRDRSLQMGTPNSPVKVASTFAELLDRLQFPFARLEAWIRAGEVEPIAQWLATGGKPDACDRQTGDSLLILAIRHRQQAIVRELLHWRAVPPQFSWEQAEASGDPEIIRLIRAAWDQRMTWLYGPRPGPEIIGPSQQPRPNLN
jgi:uncharacterized protein (TIGR02996 family)